MPPDLPEEETKKTAYMLDEIEDESEVDEHVEHQYQYYEC
jgi:hypothetical protein